MPTSATRMRVASYHTVSFCSGSVNRLKYKRQTRKTMPKNDVFTATRESDPVGRCKHHEIVPDLQIGGGAAMKLLKKCAATASVDVLERKTRYRRRSRERPAERG